MIKQLVENPEKQYLLILIRYGIMFLVGHIHCLTARNFLPNYEILIFAKYPPYVFCKSNWNILLRLTICILWGDWEYCRLLSFWLEIMREALTQVRPHLPPYFTRAVATQLTLWSNSPPTPGPTVIYIVRISDVRDETHRHGNAHLGWYNWQKSTRNML